MSRRQFRDEAFATAVSHVHTTLRKALRLDNACSVETNLIDFTRRPAKALDCKKGPTQKKQTTKERGEKRQLQKNNPKRRDRSEETAPTQAKRHLESWRNVQHHPPRSKRCKKSKLKPSQDHRYAPIERLIRSLLL